MKRIGSMSFLTVVMVLAGCVSTTYNGYSEGTVKYSDISYNYTAKPILTDPNSKTYQITSKGLSVTSVRCKAKGKPVTIAINGATDSWDCELAGLDVKPGDKVEMRVIGIVD